MSYRRFNSNEQDLLQDIMRLRRDVRGNRFVDQALDESDLNRILNAGLMAPSVGFSQPWRFVVIRDQKTRSQISKIFGEENSKAEEVFRDQGRDEYLCLKLEGIQESAVNVALFYEAQEAPVLGQTSMAQMGEYSTVCAVQNMWLMARALNIGLGWVSILNEDKVGELLGASPRHKLVAYLCIGHVDTFYDKPELETLGWDKRKLKNEVVFDEYLPPA